MTSDEIVRAVLDTYIANTNDKIVLAVIAWHANSEGVCWPSRQRISEMTGLCERSVSKSVAELLRRGYISRAFGDHATPTYKINFGKLALAADGQTSATAAKAEPPPESKAPAVAEEPTKTRTRTVFRPPTLEEVAEYCREQGWSWEPAKFHDYNTSRGWRIGRQQMKDWKAAARTWNRNEQTYSRRPSVTAPRVINAYISEREDSARVQSDLVRRKENIMTNQELLAELATVQPTAAKRFEPRKISDRLVAYFAKAMAKQGYVHTSATLDALRATLEGYNVCLVGDPGVGKTSFFEALSSVTALYLEIFPDLTETPWMARINMREVAWFSQADVEDFLRLSAGVPLLIDDVGAEPMMSYGNNNAIFDMILEQRLKCSSQTFMTRSLRGKDFVARYGDSTVSRIWTFKMFDLGMYAAGANDRRNHKGVRFESRMCDLDHNPPCRDDDPVKLH